MQAGLKELQDFFSSNITKQRADEAAAILQAEMTLRNKMTGG